MQDVNTFHKEFYKDSNKVRQDQFLSRFCVSFVPHRKRPRDNTKPKAKTNAYFVQKKSSADVRVCRTAFLRILGITKHRVNGVVDRFQLNGDLTEKRGGDRKSKLYANKLIAVKSFIKSLKADESHYCRGKSVRQYLPAELNISKLHKMYNQKSDADNQVKFSYFHHVFTTYFNVGFGSPKTDACSTCIEFNEKIQAEDDADKKKRLQTEKAIHTVRAKAFFDILKEKKDGLMTFSYDCEKNLVLPKVPDQRAYYSRQLYCYNFTIVKGSSKCHLNKNTVLAYSWLENERLKGSNEIASAVYHCLKKSETTMDETHTVRLVSDGCPGQNKNCTLLTMGVKWLQEAPRQIRELQIIFPVTGHSYLPPDRVFGVTEKKLKRMDTIILPTEYHHVFEEQATVFLVGKDWNVQNWKEEAEKNIKAPGSLHFKISQIKRLILKRTPRNHILVSGEMTYRNSTSNLLPVTKRGRKISDIAPTELPVGVLVKEAKKQDIESLLTVHFGKEWRNLPNLAFYKGVIESDMPQEEEEEVPNEGESELTCEFLEEILPI